MLTGRRLFAEEERQAWVGETVQRFPALRGRLSTLHIPGERDATFRAPATRALVRERVIGVLVGPKSDKVHSGPFRERLKTPLILSIVPLSFLT